MSAPIEGIQIEFDDLKIPPYFPSDLRAHLIYTKSPENPPPRTSSLNGSPKIIKRGLILADSFSADLKRASLLTQRQLSKQSRRPGSAGSTRSSIGGALDNSTASSRIEIHLVIVNAATVKDEEDGQDMIIALIRSTGAQVYVHVVPPEDRPSSPLAFRNRFTRQKGPSRSTIEDTPLAVILKEAFDMVSLVLNSKQVDSLPRSQDELQLRFLKWIASRCLIEARSKDKKEVPRLMFNPVITVFIPSRPTSGDFDFDDPETTPTAELVARATSESLSTLLRGNKVSPQEWSEAKKGTNLPATSLRRASGLSEMARKITLPPRPDHRLTLLRPAPGAGPMSVTMRLPIWDVLTDAPDLVLKISEATSPVDEFNPMDWKEMSKAPAPTTSTPGRKPSLRRTASSRSVRSSHSLSRRPSTGIRTNSMNADVFKRSSKSSLKNSTAACPKPKKAPRAPAPPRPPRSLARPKSCGAGEMLIPLSHLPPTPPHTPPGSRFRLKITPPLSDVDEPSPALSRSVGPAEPSPNSSTDTLPFHPHLYSPIDKLPPRLTRADSWDSLASTDENPRWGRVRSLLMMRHENDTRDLEEAYEVLEKELRTGM